MNAPDRIWARPIGATLDWTGAASGPWALDDPHKTGTVFLASTPAREHAEELVEHLIWIRYQIDDHGFSEDGPMLSRTTALLSKLDQ